MCIHGRFIHLTVDGVDIILSNSRIIVQGDSPRGQQRARDLDTTTMTTEGTILGMKLTELGMACKDIGNHLGGMSPSPWGTLASIRCQEDDWTVRATPPRRAPVLMSLKRRLGSHGRPPENPDFELKDGACYRYLPSLRRWTRESRSGGGGGDTPRRHQCFRDRPLIV